VHTNLQQVCRLTRIRWCFKVSVLPPLFPLKGVQMHSYTWKNILHSVIQSCYTCTPLHPPTDLRAHCLHDSGVHNFFENLKISEGISFRPCQGLSARHWQ